MSHPLAAIIRMIASPKLSVPAPGVLRAHMPFLKLIGRKSGEITIDAPPDKDPTGGWITVMGDLLPGLRALSYDTSKGTVDLRHTTDANLMALRVRHLADLAAESAGGFIGMDRAEREKRRREISQSIRNQPVDLARESDLNRFREIVSNR